MAKHILKAVSFGLLGLLLGCIIVKIAVSQWTSLNTMWINAAGILPLLGIAGAFGLARAELGPNRGAYRAICTVLAALLGSLGSYMAFVITSGTWFADRIPLEHQGLFFQLLHPGVLPTFVERSSSASSGTETTWLASLIIGFVVSPLIFLWFTRSPKTTSAASP
jgi:hypothetical protein